MRRQEGAGAGGVRSAGSRLPPAPRRPRASSPGPSRSGRPTSATSCVRPAPAGGGPFLVAIDGVTDPGNLGAILRSAEVAGASGVVLPSHRAVRLTPAAVKAAAGAVEHLPIALVGGLPAALLRMREQGLWIAGLDGDGDAGLDELEPRPSRMALVLGAEGRGLGRLVATGATSWWRSPGGTPRLAQRVGGRGRRVHGGAAAAPGGEPIGAVIPTAGARPAARRAEPEVGIEPTTPALQGRCSGR